MAAGALVAVGMGTAASAARAQAPEAGEVILSSYPFYRSNLREIPMERLTHVVYAFVEHGPGGIVRPRPEDTGFTVNTALLRAHRQRIPRLRLLLGIGGGGWSEGFAPATVPSRVTRSARSAVALMRRQGFDGIDIDWESPRPGTAEPAQYVAYLAALRRELNALGRGNGRTYTLSTDVGFLVSDPFNEQAKEQTPPAAARYVDLWNVMAYEMRGPWNCFGDGGGAGFNAPLRARRGDPYVRNSVAAAVTGWRRAGVPARKIVLGVPFYGTLFNGVPAGPRGDGLGQACNGTAGRQIDGSELARLSTEQGFTAHYDAHSEAGYRYNPATRQFLSVETARSIAAKRRFARQQGLGGMMAWDLGADGAGYPLLRALSGP